jgi:hypothetical protein
VLKSSFPGRYRPTDKEFRKMWSEGLFVLDGNALLNLYRYSNHTRQQLIEVLRGLKERLWLPHQVAYEFMNRRLTVLADQKQRYAQLREHLNTIPETVEKRTSELHRDSALRAEDMFNPANVRQSLEDFVEYLRGLEERSPRTSNSPEEDEVWQVVDEVFDGKIGEPYPPDKKKSILQEGEKRYTQRVPPGYEDQEKGGEEQYGDLLVWFQILDKVEQDKKPLIFVTDDRKGDWWWIFDKLIIGPRPELIDEVQRRAGVLSYIYPPGRFIGEAQRFLGTKVSEEAIAEAQELNPLDEEPYALSHPSETAFPSDTEQHMLLELDRLLENGPTHVLNHQIVEIGAGADLSEPYSYRLFRRLMRDGKVEGSLITIDEHPGFVGAWIEDVRL